MPPPNFNPFQVKVALSTGAKGRRRFDAGRVKLLRNAWKARGVQVVPVRDAEYIVLPDGATDKGQSGRFATAVHYSDFLELLSRYTRPPPPAAAAAPSFPDAIPPSTSTHAIVKHDLSGLERRLYALSERPRERHPSSYRRVTASPSPSPNLLSSIPLTPEPTTYVSFLTPTVEWAVVKHMVEKLRAMSQLPAFVTEAVTGHTRMYPTLYTSKQQTLEELRRLVLTVLTFWQELRVNVEVVLTAELPPRVDFEAWTVCEVPAALGLPYDLTSSWTYFFDHWSTENVSLFTQPVVLANLADRAAAAQYFWTMETNLYVNYASVQCAQHRLRKQFVEWVKTTRERFRHTPRCVPEQRARCPTQFCVLYNDQCQEKPILFVLEELVMAFCGSTELLPLTREDYETVNQFYNLVAELYHKWYGQPRVAAETQKGVCVQIMDMVQVMLATLREEMDVESVQGVLWSDLVEVSPANALSRDWNDSASVATLRSMLFSDAYKQRVKAVGETLLRL